MLLLAQAQSTTQDAGDKASLESLPRQPRTESTYLFGIYLDYLTSWKILRSHYEVDAIVFDASLVSDIFIYCFRRLQDLPAAMRGVRGAGDLHVRLGVPQDGGPGEDQSDHGIWPRDRSAHLLLASTWACAWTASCSGAAACTTPRTTSSRTRATPPAR